MNDFNTSIARGRTMDASVDAGLRTFMLGVYSKLTIGIAIAGILAFAAGTVPAIRDLVFGTPLYYVVMFAPPALIFGSMFFMKNPSPTGSAILYWAIVATVGLGLGVYFALAQANMSITTAGGISQSFTYMTIAKAFFITASAFAALSLWGYTTKRDLSAIGSFAIMAVIWMPQLPNSAAPALIGSIYRPALTPSPIRCQRSLRWHGWHCLTRKPPPR